MSSAQPLGTAFTYQGRLNDGGGPADGTYDLRFILFDAGVGGTQQGPAVTRDDVTVTGGLFTVSLDFGAVFSGSKRWLEVGVRPGASTGTYAVLNPRQELTPSPGALFAATANSFAGSLAGEVTGTQGATVVASAVAANTPNAVVRRDASGGFSAGTITGALDGNITGSAATFTGGLAGDITGTQSDTRVAQIQGRRVSAAAPTDGQILKYDGSGARWIPASDGGLLWQVVSGNTQQAQPNTGYVMTSDAQVTVTLPASPSIGDVVRVSGAGPGGWTIAQNDGQAVRLRHLPSAGSDWTPRESQRQWATVASSADGDTLVAGVNGGQLYTSTDAGVSWRASPITHPWIGVASSADGNSMVAAGIPSPIYTSTDGGVNWTPRTASANWRAVASSADGSRLAAASDGNPIYISTDGGATWTPRAVSAAWRGVASSSDGSRLVAAGFGSQIYTSTDAGVSWTPHEGNRNWISVASSADGSRLVAAVENGRIYASTDGGASWTTREQARDWASIASSADGNKLVAAVEQGQIYTSNDAGVSWTPRESNRLWWSVASSADGTRLVAAILGGYLYTSTGTASATTTPGPGGYLLGEPASAMELQYIGGGMFLPLSHEGVITGR